MLLQRPAIIFGCGNRIVNGFFLEMGHFWTINMGLRRLRAAKILGSTFAITRKSHQTTKYGRFELYLLYIKRKYCARVRV